MIEWAGRKRKGILEGIKDDLQKLENIDPQEKQRQSSVHRLTRNQEPQ
jgi:hypothetical protein